MATISIPLCKPNELYIITETIHLLIALGKGKIGSADGIVVGMETFKVYRQVLQACLPQDYIVDGENKGDNIPTNWEYIKYYFGFATITGQDKPNVKPKTVLKYSGGTNYGSSFHWKHKRLPLPEIVKFGKDPVPHVKLYGKKGMKFYSDAGQDTLSIIVMYDPRNTEDPITVVPKKDKDKLLEMLRRRVSRYK